MKPKQTPLANAIIAAAASSGALFALQHNVEAAIVYSGPKNLSATIADPLSNSTNAQASILLNFDGAGANDGRVFLQFFNTVYYNHRSGRVGLNPPAGNPFIQNASGHVKRLASGALISAGGNLNFGGFGVLKRYGTNIPPYGVQGTWAAGQTGFAGLRFNTGSNDHFGWLRMKWEDTDANSFPDKLTVVDWGYNNVPGQSIQAGQTSSVPEPGTNALLALAGAGTVLAHYRRRKRQQQQQRDAEAAAGAGVTPSPAI